MATAKLCSIENCCNHVRARGWCHKHYARWKRHGDPNGGRSGIRSDNRPENLELWVTHQPSGQRPDDLLRWAKEIIALYGNGELT